MEAVTQASLLDAIRLAMGRAVGPDDAMTIQELARWIADDTGASVAVAGRKIREAIPKLRAEGVLELVRVRRQSVDDRQITSVAFRFKGT